MRSSGGWYGGGVDFRKSGSKQGERTLLPNTAAATATTLILIRVAAQESGLVERAIGGTDSLIGCQDSNSSGGEDLGGREMIWR